MAYVFNPLSGTFDIVNSPTMTIGEPIPGSTAYGILSVSGSNTLSEIGPLTNGQLIIGSTGGAAVAASLTGTSNQITVTPGSGSITLSLPQNINTTSSPTFSSLSLTNPLTVANGGTGLTTTNQSYFFAGPSSGSGAPTWRAIVGTDLPSLSGTYVPVSEVGAANGVAPLDASSKISSIYLPSTVLQYQGLWAPSTNTPTLQDSTGTAGYVYQVSGGTLPYAGPISGLNNSSMVNFQLGNLIIFSGTLGQWEQTTPAAGVQTVNGAQGNVTINAINQLTGDVTAGPASGSQSQAATLATVNSNVGTFGSSSSIPSFTVNGKGLITAASSNSITTGNLTDVGTDGITVTGGTGAVWGSGTSISQHVADTTHNGYLSSTDWNTFNGKGSGTVTSISVSTANGFAGSSSGGATPALTLTTSVTGILKGNGTAISAATSGTDYSAGTSALATGILKSTTTTGALTIAVAGDFPTLNQDTTGTAAKATQVATTSTSTNANFYPTFVASSSTGNQGIDMSSGLVYNPSTGSLSTTTVVANLTGNADTSTNTSGLIMTTSSTNASFYPVFVSSTGANVPPKANTNLSYNPSTATLTTTTFVGALTGNASTVTTNANLTGPVTSVGNATAVADGALATTKIGGTNTQVMYIDSTGFMGGDSAFTFNDTTKVLSTTGANFSGLTASQAVVTDGSKNLASLAYSTTPAASTLAEWDANKNLSANNYIQGYATTATAAGTTTLTVGSAEQQYFTGTSTQTVVLPVTSTLVLGQSFTIVNSSTGSVTVQSSGANNILVQTAGTAAIYTVISTSGTTAASWNVQTLAGGAAIPPTVQKFTSGSGTYTTPAGVIYIRVRMVGGGAGGSGSGSSPGLGTGGNQSTFGSSLLTAGGGSAPSGQTAGGLGGTNTLNSPAIGSQWPGGAGQPIIGNGSTTYEPGGAGGNTMFGGGGAGGTAANGNAGGTNTGAGGGGAGNTTANSAGAGGGAGGSIDAIIPNPAATYAYTVGASAAGGTIGGGTGAAVGGAGAAGYIEVTEFYANGAPGNGGAIAPQITTYTSGSGTYTVPTGASYLRVRMVGGGGGGGGSGSGATAGNAGTAATATTFFNASAGAGGGGGTVGGARGTGGTASLGAGASGTVVPGPDGGAGSEALGGNTVAGLTGGSGGSTPFGGGTGGGAFGGAGGTTGNYGSGGGGASIANTTGNIWSGGGGGAAGFVDMIITNPTTSYNYAVGVAGSGGSNGTSGYAGGAGAAGYIEITAYMSNGAIGTATNVTGVVAVANGGTGLTGPTVMRVRATSGSISNGGTDQAVTLSTVDIDTASLWNGTTTATAVTAGYYSITFVADFTTNITGLVILKYQINSGTKVATGACTNPTQYTQIGGSDLIHLNANDTVTFWINQNSSGSITIDVAKALLQLVH